MKDIVKIAFKIAEKAHRGQFRNDNKTPYITHPVTVMENLKKKLLRLKDDKILKYCKWYGKNSFSILLCASLLHDVFEDTKLTSKDLIKKRMPKKVVELVELLTHKSEDSYLKYLLKIKYEVPARLIKIEDIKNNLSTLEPWNKSKRDKYMLALYILEH
jgi:(p)ppGpp synthase/HD superfamily hydrolase